MQGVGNGGMGGSLNLPAMALALKYHYATASTDTGHRGGDADAAWALGHPEQLADLSWRSIHLTAVVAKQAIRAFYGRPPRYSYFSGGSNAGRQALIEAQRFPDDYDGIVAGAPALDPANNLSTAAWLQWRLLREPAGFIPAAKAPGIAAAVLRACDADDGVRDGVVDDPVACGFDPRSMLCAGIDASDCLTSPQAAWLRDLYDGPGGHYRGHRNWGLARGGEQLWVPWWFSSAPEANLGSIFSASFFRYMVYDDPNWQLASLDYLHDRAAAAERASGSFDANDPDLSRFHARGGRLILYQGWGDPLVPPRIPIDYYERVRATMGAAAADETVRLYMAPGMGHVIGGFGPNVFGQLAPGGASDPRHSVNAAIEAWVERGVAPGAIVAGKYADDLAAQLAPGSVRALRERPLCPYPQLARWTGAGSTDVAANFRCVEAGARR